MSGKKTLLETAAGYDRFAARALARKGSCAGQPPRLAHDRLRPSRSHRDRLSGGIVFLVHILLWTALRPPTLLATSTRSVASLGSLCWERGNIREGYNSLVVRYRTKLRAVISISSGS